MIELQNITAGYAQRPVLHGVSLTCASARITALVGPNGCGKSTLLKVAGRLLSPQNGKVLIAGADACVLTRKEFAKRVAVLPQMRNVPSLTARSLVLHGRFAHLGYPRRYSAQDKAEAQRAMERTGAAAFADIPMASLSGGERQKVYLAMALAQAAPILLLDEPTTYLDIAHQLELMALLRAQQAEGKTVLMVLHDLNLALQYADQVAVLSGGVLQKQGTPEEIYQSGVLQNVFSVAIEKTAARNGPPQYLFSQRRPG